MFYDYKPDFSTQVQLPKLDGAKLSSNPGATGPRPYPFPWPIKTTVGATLSNAYLRPPYNPPPNIPGYSNLVVMPEADDTWGSLARITCTFANGPDNSACSRYPVINGITCTFYDNSTPIPQIPPTWNRTITAPISARLKQGVKPSVNIPPLVSLTKIEVVYSNTSSCASNGDCCASGCSGIRISWIDRNGVPGSDFCTSTIYGGMIYGEDCANFNTWTYHCRLGDQIRGISAYSQFSPGPDYYSCNFDRYQGSVLFNLLFRLARTPASMNVTSLTPINVDGTNCAMVADGSCFLKVSDIASATALNASTTNPLYSATKLESTWVSSSIREDGGETSVIGGFELGVEFGLKVGFAVTDIKASIGISGNIEIGKRDTWKNGTEETTEMKYTHTATTSLLPCTACRYVMTGLNSKDFSIAGKPSNTMACYASGQVLWYDYRDDLPSYTQSVDNFYLVLTAVDTRLDFSVVQNDLNNPCIQSLTGPTGPTGPQPPGPVPSGPTGP